MASRQARAETRGRSPLETAQGWSRRNWPVFVLALMCLGWVLWLGSISSRYLPTGAQDEIDIVGPAMSTALGELPARVKYPGFAFRFYGLLIALSGTAGEITDALGVARTANLVLFCLNLFLLYLFLGN